MAVEFASNSMSIDVAGGQKYTVVKFELMVQTTTYWTKRNKAFLIIYNLTSRRKTLIGNFGPFAIHAWQTYVKLPDQSLHPPYLFPTTYQQVQQASSSSVCLVADYIRLLQLRYVDEEIKMIIGYSFALW
jgi:hypothetical protein